MSRAWGIPSLNLSMWYHKMWWRSKCDDEVNVVINPPVRSTTLISTFPVMWLIWIISANQYEYERKFHWHSKNVILNPLFLLATPSSAHRFTSENCIKQGRTQYELAILAFQTHIILEAFQSLFVCLFETKHYTTNHSQMFISKQN